MDLHRKRSQVAAVNEEGTVLFNRNVASNDFELLEVFGELQGMQPQVAFEATYGWGWFADLLTDAGVPGTHGASAGDEGHGST